MLSCPRLSRASTPLVSRSKAWMAGTSPAMTAERRFPHPHPEEARSAVSKDEGPRPPGLHGSRRPLRGLLTIRV
jgi:hypothetical protein